ncbi:signal peptidase II [Blochmannia endosymbiont of Camponotus sp.]|uniref:signal peptidase II n=1 Tax=Blochmannia endosymbiont of Camponotus sp. TaxID=700220 RepID=UPI002024A764|nr:signal peptidase II [Blochmannia endosymbiont of Camponotus sp.]URJ30238.1 signal peptidase II [Blochmannia endosymbiont of Camponotus sp.]
MQHKKYNHKNLKWLWLSILLMLLDIETKYLIKTHFLVGEILSVLPGINFYYIRNSGLAFGIFANVDLCYRWTFIWITILIIIAFVITLYKMIGYSKYYSVSCSMIIGGALGNLLDRVLYGTVVDFIDIYIKSWHWPTFNIADMAICIGTIVLIVKHYYDC